MTPRMQSNGIDSTEIEFYVTMDRDSDGIFLTISGSDWNSGEEYFEYIATKVEDIDEFFLAVKAAKEHYEQLKG